MNYLTPSFVRPLSVVLIVSILLAGSVCAVAAASSDNVLHNEPEIALLGVTVLDGTGAMAQPDQTVLLKDARIVAVGSRGNVAVPDSAKRLHLPNHTVIPGLIGMHDHTHVPGMTFLGDVAARLWLASGVTSVQTAGSAEPEAELELARAIATGEKPGPTLYATAPYLTGPGGNGPMSKPESPEAARAFVREWSARGVTGFKLYRHIQPAIAAAVIDEAHILKRRVSGHLCSLTFGEAARLGIDGIEHGLISATDFIEDKPAGACVSNRQARAALSLDEPRVLVLIDELIEHGVQLTSTLAVIESHFPHRPQADQRSLAMLSPAWRERYQQRQARLAESRDDTRFTPALFTKLLAFERLFHARGGTLLMGPDPGRHVLPGFGNQRGFELLVEAGLSVPEAVKVATANGADALDEGGRLGRVAPGYQADLVVLRGDLANDPAAIRRVAMTFRDGVAYNPKALLETVKGQVGLP